MSFVSCLLRRLVPDPEVGVVADPVLRLPVGADVLEVRGAVLRPVALQRELVAARGQHLGRPRLRLVRVRELGRAPPARLARAVGVVAGLVRAAVVPPGRRDAVLRQEAGEVRVEPEQLQAVVGLRVADRRVVQVPARQEAADRLERALVGGRDRLDGRDLEVERLLRDDRAGAVVHVDLAVVAPGQRPTRDVDQDHEAGPLAGRRGEAARALRRQRVLVGARPEADDGRRRRDVHEAGPQDPHLASEERVGGGREARLELAARRLDRELEALRLAAQRDEACRKRARRGRRRVRREPLGEEQRTGVGRLRRAERSRRGGEHDDQSGDERKPAANRDRGRQPHVATVVGRLGRRVRPSSE